MIKGVHAMFYTPRAEEARAVLRDKVGLKCTDVGEGWLIFDVPEAEIGFHPGEGTQHAISLYCDDIEGEVAALKAKGVGFEGQIHDEGWGRVINMLLPGGVKVGLYEPRYRK